MAAVHQWELCKMLKKWMKQELMQMLLHQWNPILLMMLSMITVVYPWELCKILKLMTHKLLKILLYQRQQLKQLCHQQ